MARTHLEKLYFKATTTFDRSEMILAKIIEEQKGDPNDKKYAKMRKKRLAHQEKYIEFKKLHDPEHKGITTEKTRSAEYTGYTGFQKRHGLDVGLTSPSYDWSGKL